MNSLMKRSRSAVLSPILALSASLLVGAAVMLLSGVDPIAAYGSLLNGAFGSTSAIGRTLANATPLILTGLAVALPFRGGLFNIGADGQFAAGAVTAAWLGVSLRLPGVLGPIAILIASAMAGAIVGAIAGYLKSRFKAHEVVTTIMLNFILINFAMWLLLHPLSAHTQVPGSAQINSGNALPQIFASMPKVHFGFIVAILGAIVATVFLWRTPAGLELRIAGISPKAAKYSGVKPTMAALIALGGGGAFAGLAGAGEVLGTYGNMTVPFVTNLGFLGIGVALLGRNHPIGCIVGGLILGALSAGGQRMQFDLGISAHLTEILVGLILIFISMRIVRTKRHGRNVPTPLTGVEVGNAR
ncbi:MAG: ABC transporter permease [Candidatus Nanopelagicaceae bacterium]|nr:ABC transporter permease [Candidatus Nanopelagicaceae bacterium]